MAFVDLTTAFNSVNHQTLVAGSGKEWLPRQYIQILRLMHVNVSCTALCSYWCKSRLCVMVVGGQPLPHCSAPSHPHTCSQLGPLVWHYLGSVQAPVHCQIGLCMYDSPALSLCMFSTLPVPDLPAFYPVSLPAFCP